MIQIFILPEAERAPVSVHEIAVLAVSFVGILHSGISRISRCASLRGSDGGIFGSPSFDDIGGSS
jgi:hypothetical protein